jgi:hypothetical protein
VTEWSAEIQIENLQTQSQYAIYPYLLQHEFNGSRSHVDPLPCDPHRGSAPNCRFSNRAKCVVGVNKVLNSFPERELRTAKGDMKNQLFSMLMVVIIRVYALKKVWGSKPQNYLDFKSWQASKLGKLAFTLVSC